MFGLFKKTKLYNGKEIKEGDLVYFINSDGIRCEKQIERRKFNCTHQDTGKKLKKGTLFFWNVGFEPSDYMNADVVVPKGTLCEPHGCINYSQGYDRCDNQCKKCKDLL